MEVLLHGHADLEIDRLIDLDRESFARIVTWIDINAPYYPDYASAYPEHPYGRSPLPSSQLDQLSTLTGINFSDQTSSSSVSFSPPELGPCLNRFTDRDDPRRKQALAIIRSGAERLKQHPRADMSGFRMNTIDATRQQRYHALVGDSVILPNVLQDMRATDQNISK